MVYTEAVILETLRISSVAAMAVPHMALEDAQLGNYVIPKVCLFAILLFRSYSSRGSEAKFYMF